jgi:hypothetical protein
VKLATVFEDGPLVCFLLAKGLNAKDIHKEMFSVYGGKYLSRKAVHIWVDKFSQGRSKVADEAEVAGTTVRRFYVTGFDALAKRWTKVYQRWWKKCREINILSRLEYHTLYVLYPFVTYLLTLSLFRNLQTVAHWLGNITQEIPLQTFDSRQLT